MSKKSIYSPRVVVASAQGDVIHIKSKQSGRVVLKLKLMPTRFPSEYELLLDMSDSLQVTYSNDHQAWARIAAFERGEVAK